MNSDVTIPNFDYFFEPIIRVLQALGSSATIQEIYDRVCELESFSEEQQAILHKEGCFSGDRQLRKSSVFMDCPQR